MLKIYITRQFGNEKSQNVFSYKTRNQAKMQNLKAKKVPTLAQILAPPLLLNF